MLRTLTKITLGGTAGVVLATTLAATPAEASDGYGLLCRTKEAVMVYSPVDWEPKYVIPAGRDMRVHYRSADGNYFYGHGGGHGDDGWAGRLAFSSCR